MPKTSVELEPTREYVHVLTAGGVPENMVPEKVPETYNDAVAD